MPDDRRPKTRPQLAPGDHTPQFACPDSTGKTFEFYSAVSGKPVVMIFTGERPLKDLAAAGLDPRAVDTGTTQVITIVPGDAKAAEAQKAAAAWPHRVMGDPGAEVTRGFAQFSAVAAPAVYVLDPNQRVVAIAPADDVAGDFAAWVAAKVGEASFAQAPTLIQNVAPVLVVPRALEAEDCCWLIDLWRRGDKEDGRVAVGQSSGGGLAVVPTTKRREDFYIRDPEDRDRVTQRLMSRLVPEISKIYHFEGYALETFKVGCYKADQAGFFNVHRDDTSPATKDRKFAITVNLNTGEYEGGDLRFPEYGPETYRPPRGGAIVFSCSMLHEVVPVTAGERFVLLTFLVAPGR